jgi:hypothetical protein
MLEDELFAKHFPVFTEEEAAQAAAAPIVSLSGRAGVPNVFVLALATENGRFAPVALTRRAAVELRSLLQGLGF